MSKIEQIITEIEEYIDNCKFQPLSTSKIIVNKDDIDELLAELRLRTPEEIKKYRNRAEQVKTIGNVSIDVREKDDDLSYLDMDDLTYLAEPEGKKDTSKASLHRDGQTYKPMRDAMAHTARLTQAAKTLLTGTFENIKARVVTLLLKSGSDKK